MKKSMFCSVLACWLTFAGTIAQAQSPSELLEKGIYAEETVGNLDQAIGLYKKAVEEAKSAEATAAEAQYRLGQCLLKQKKDTEAVTTFKKLIESYPNQQIWVAKARKQLPAEGNIPLEKAPWKDGEFFQLGMKMAGGMKIGIMTFYVESAQKEHRDVWEMTSHRLILVGGDNRTLSKEIVDKKTSKPIESIFNNSVAGEFSVFYKDNEAEAVAKESKKTFPLEKTYYDNEQCYYTFRQLPLAEVYKVDLPIFSPMGAGKIHLPLSVLGKETIEVPAGKFECFKIHLDMVNQDFWISADENRYIVKFEAGGIAGELEKVGIQKPGEMKQYKNEKLGVSFDLPYDWYYYVHEKDKDVTLVFLLDPKEAGLNVASVAKITEDEAAELKNDAPKALKTWAEKTLALRAKELKEYKVQKNSWSSHTIGGQPAVTVRAEYFNGDKKMFNDSIFIMSGNVEVAFECRSGDAKGLDKLFEDLNKIADSLKIE